MSRHTCRIVLLSVVLALAALVVRRPSASSADHPGGAAAATDQVAASPTSPSAPRHARVDVHGSVVDARLQPIAGVQITLESGGRVVLRATTAADGTFRFEDVAPSSYRVRAEHTGFIALTRDLRVPSDSATVTLPLVLVTAADQKAMADEVAGSARDAATGAGQGRQNSSLAAPMAAPMPAPSFATATQQPRQMASTGIAAEHAFPIRWPGPRGDRYARVTAHRFHTTTSDPLSTFGADVDTAAYANVRRMISSGQLPPTDAVRVEEFLNYFRFPYAPPSGGRAVSLTTEIGDCPWAPGHKLVLIGARADTRADREITGRNLVLLIDVSGSMSPIDRLPMLKSALAIFVDSLRPDDQISIVTYAGSSGVALPPTSARQRDVIQRAIAQLGAGGSTNGGQGLQMAYRLARQAFIPGGVNRVILATDGDFNVGVTSDDELLAIVERQKASGVFLSVLGVGAGNLNDAMMELIADRGNGHYAYLDSIREAQRVLVREAGSTLEVVARDVKFQVEFNPARVAAWKQIGYENRALAAEDFNDDRKDAGEMGAGHTVTVLYEIVPVGVALPDDAAAATPASVDPLKYQPAQTNATARSNAPSATTASDAWLTVKARYQPSAGGTSLLVSKELLGEGRATWLPLASAVAEFALLVRDRSSDLARWTALERRVSQLVVPPSLASEVHELVELVATSRSLARLAGGQGDGASDPIR